MASDQEAGEPPKRRKRRWGVAAPAAGGDYAPAAGGGGLAATNGGDTAEKGPIAAAAPNLPPLAATGADDPRAKVLAMQESIRARLAAAKARTATATATIPASAATRFAGKRPLDAASPPATTATSSDNQAKRAKHFDVDFTVVTGPPKSVTPVAGAGVDAQRSVAAPSRKLNPYLAHAARGPATKPGDGAASAAPPSEEGASAAGGEELNEEGSVVDARLVRASKPRARHKALQFVEPGHWQQVAERKREQAAKAEAAGYISGRKIGHTISSTTMADVYGPSSSAAAVTATTSEYDDDPSAHPRADAVPEPEGMPLVMEWWDVALLPVSLKREVAALESQILARHTKAAMQQLDSADVGGDRHRGGGDSEAPTAVTSDHESKACQELLERCYKEASMAHSKTAALVQHIVPIQPPRPAAERQPVVHLTKKELKRQRKLRRQARQRELQDMQAAGLVPAPEPRLTLRNFIQVLGDQAYLDPSQMEQKVQEQMEARRRAHMERNQAAKLTKEQRAAKLARKYAEDTSGGVTVAIYRVLDLSHPYHRAKVDLNAQQNNITGGVLECQVPRLSCVICEGGPKAIKRYRRLMEVRIKWTGPDGSDDGPVAAAARPENDATPASFNSHNRCDLVWQGMAVKRHFKGFVFQTCETAELARKVLKSKGVAHYWDQVLDFHQSGRTARGLRLRLADDHTDSDRDEEDEEEDENENKDDDDEGRIIMKVEEQTLP